MFLLPLLLTGCEHTHADSAPEAPMVRPGPEPELDPRPLDAVALLNRMSLDLRGHHPSLEELSAVEADPNALYELLDQMLLDPALPGRMAWIWNERVHTGLWASSFDRFNPEHGGEFYPFETLQDMGWEPLALFELILREDRSLTELVTAQQLPSSSALPATWGSVGAESRDWTLGTYTDGRPMAGVLSSTALWLRYSENATNYNRGRANTVARVLLCADFFDRSSTSFEFSVRFDEVEKAVETEPVCTSCHAALDPLASYFGGFSENSKNLLEKDFVRYSAVEDAWHRGLIPPSYYGHPAAGLTELGQHIAADPRFASCFVEHFYEALTGDNFTLDEDLAALTARFRADDLHFVPMLRELLLLPEYGQARRRLMSPELMAQSMQEFTGWAPGDGLDDGFTALAWDPEHRVLAGGADDVEVLQRNDAVTVSALVASEWAGRAGADAAIQADLERALEDRVLMKLPDSPDEDAVRGQLAEWCTRAWGRRVLPDSEETDALFALWTAGGGDKMPNKAWSLALEAVLRHPDTLVY